MFTLSFLPLLVWTLALVAQVSEAGTFRGRRRHRSLVNALAEHSNHTQSRQTLERRASASVSVPGWDYLGCFTDGGSARALTGSYTTSNSMTVETCLATCRAGGFIYAGVEYGKQCYCGNELSNNQGSKASTSCTNTCSGSSSQICGGSYAMSLYAQYTVESLGCFQDSKDKLMKGPSFSSAAYMTPTLCAAWCYQRKYLFSGVEYGSQCFCSATPPSCDVVVDDSKCTMPCAAKDGTICGGSWLLNAYEVTALIAPPMTTTTTSTATTATPTKTLTTATSTSTAVSLTPLGCFSDPVSPRTLTGPSFGNSGMTPTLCGVFCANLGYAIAGVEYATQCFCGSSVASNKKVDDARCNSPCGGDKSAACGGSYVLNAYTVKTATSAQSCTGNCSATIGVSSVPSSNTKYLWAHHMVGNTYSYTPATWADDVSQAAGAGFDGFALNYGRDYWQPARLSNAYAAAEAQGKFKMFLSLDFASLGCDNAAQAATYANQILTYGASPAQARYKNKILVSTFAGESCTFGQRSVSDGWTYLRSLVDKGNSSMYLIPAIFSSPSTFANDKWYDGIFNWNGAWPTYGSSDPLSTASDTQYMNALGNRGYMAAISPLFFTYYSPQTYNKNWIYRSDDWLLARRFEQLIQLRRSFDMAELVTWNDYGEAHYVGPVRADQPNSQGWTNGMPHTAWLNLIAYYAPAFKTGSYPAINQDKLFLWTRPHSRDATPSSPTLARPQYSFATDDNLYALVLLRSPATVTITSGSSSGTWSLPSGLSKLSINSAAGAISGKVVRGSSTVINYDSSSTFTYKTTPTDYNYNYFVAEA